MTEREALEALRGDDPDLAQRAEAVLWRLWHDSGRPELDAIMGKGLQAIEGGDLDEAERQFSRLIETEPEFPEGWNKRATVRYIAKDYPGSIADCRETLARNPSHFGALSGQGLCYLALGEHQAAAQLFRRALAVHPHLSGARDNLRLAIAELVKGN